MPYAFSGVTGVRAMLVAFRHLGLDGDAIARAAGMSFAALADADRLVPAGMLYRMWTLASEAWGRPGLGLAAGRAVPAGAYEVLDYLLASASTLGEGMTDFARYFAVATRTARYDIYPDALGMACEMVWQIPPAGVMFEVRDYSLATVAGRVRATSGCVPVRVEITGAPMGTQAEYDEALGAPTALSATRNALVFGAAAWHAAQPRRDAWLHQTLRRHADTLLERHTATTGAGMAERVRAEVLQRVRIGVPAVEEVARGLGLGVRTLQRQLRLEGVSFADLVDAVRSNLAREYLADERVSIAEMSYLLGFSEPSAFSRAFRRWTGQSPQSFRAATGGQSVPPSA
ncbi:MAG TPA: AraC family transcriptional regulator ligand-binding domain-containing protein [Vicinamibacterales bacterium]|nr:AraC family transcriptional regulator ligand-binding domain-containing protein [Vicinamibacterales bacterium]